jgi:hypothetical protein
LLLVYQWKDIPEFVITKFHCSFFLFSHPKLNYLFLPTSFCLLCLIIIKIIISNLYGIRNKITCFSLVANLIWHTYSFVAAHLNNNEWNIITLITVNAVITDGLQIQVRGLYHKVYAKPSYHSTPLSSIILKIMFMLNAMPL